MPGSKQQSVRAFATPVQPALALLEEPDLPAWHRLTRIETYKEDDIKSSGYTVHTLEAAAWSFLTTASYEEAVARAANLGDDADTVAAVCGAPARITCSRVV